MFAPRESVQSPGWSGCRVAPRAGQSRLLTAASSTAPQARPRRTGVVEEESLGSVHLTLTNGRTSKHGHHALTLLGWGEGKRGCNMFVLSCLEPTRNVGTSTQRGSHGLTQERDSAGALCAGMNPRPLIGVAVRACGEGGTRRRVVGQLKHGENNKSNFFLSFLLLCRFVF